MDYIGILKRKFDKVADSVQIKMLKGDKTFKVTPVEAGVLVDNLGASPLLE